MIMTARRAPSGACRSAGLGDLPGSADNPQVALVGAADVCELGEVLRAHVIAETVVRVDGGQVRGCVEHAEPGEVAAQDVPESKMGSGFSLAEIGLRLRYDIRREFSPYIGVNFEKRIGRTADLARASGDEVDDTSVVLGLRAWF